MKFFVIKLAVVFLNFSFISASCASNVSDAYQFVEEWNKRSTMDNRVLAVNKNEDYTTIDIVRKHGYPGEDHRVESKDGYVLAMHRIPYGLLNNDTSKPRPVVLIFHGLLSCSANFVEMGPNKALAFLLAEKGYDVWMGNGRGNMYSRKHITLDPDVDKKFWEFTWHEIGTIDVPAIIDYILNVTGQEKMIYIGYSQGTTVFFTMMDEHPEYNDKISLLVAMAPVSFMRHVPCPVARFFAANMGLTRMVSQFFRVGEFLRNDGPIARLAQSIGSSNTIWKSMLYTYLDLIFGKQDPSQVNPDLLPLIWKNAPAGASKYQLIHYLQLVTSGGFKKYDYGPDENILKYGQYKPPDYDLTKIKIPVALYYGSNDNLAGVKDVEQLKESLPNVVESFLIPIPTWNHVDFVWGIDANRVLYPKILHIMDKYCPNADENKL